MHVFSLLSPAPGLEHNRKSVNVYWVIKWENEWMNIHTLTHTILVYYYTSVGLRRHCFSLHSATPFNCSPFSPFKLQGSLLQFYIPLCNTMCASVKVLLLAHFAVIIDFKNTQKSTRHNHDIKLTPLHSTIICYSS